MLDVKFDLDPTSKAPLYRQISSCLEDAILSGALKIGDRLPPTRHLAVRLGTARRTIVKAYNELTYRGFVECKTGVGTIVSSSCPLLSSRSAALPLPVVYQSSADSRGAHRAAPEQFDLQIQTQNPSGSTGEERLSFCVSRYAQALCERAPSVHEDSDFVSALNAAELLPRKPWRQLLLRGFTRCDEENIGHEVVHNHLRNTLHQFLARCKGVVCQPEQLLTFSGPRQALAFVARLLLDPGDSVALEDPCAPALPTFFSSYGAQISNLPIDLPGDDPAKHLDLKEIFCQVKPKLVFVTPSCQNPTGVVMGRERRAALVNWAQQTTGLIIEEAFDSDIRFGAQNVSSIQGMLPEAVIYMYSFHKILHPLTSTTVVIIPEGLLPTARRMNKEMPGINHPEEAFHQSVLNDFVGRGLMDCHLTKLRKTFQERRQVLLFSLATGLRQAICLSTATAGTQVVFSIDPAFDENFILECGQKSGLPIKSLKNDYRENKPINEFSISFSSLPTDQLKLGVERFCSLLARDPAAPLNAPEEKQVEPQEGKTEKGSARALDSQPDTILPEEKGSKHSEVTTCARDTTSGAVPHLNTTASLTNASRS